MFAFTCTKSGGTDPAIVTSSSAPFCASIMSLMSVSRTFIDNAVVLLAICGSLIGKSATRTPSPAVPASLRASLRLETNSKLSRLPSSWSNAFAGTFDSGVISNSSSLTRTLVTKSKSPSLYPGWSARLISIGMVGSSTIPKLSGPPGI